MSGYDIGATPRVPKDLEESVASGINDQMTWDNYWNALGQVTTMPPAVADYMLDAPMTPRNWVEELGHSIYISVIEPGAIVTSSIADIVANTVGTAVGSVGVGVGALAAGAVGVASYTLGGALWLVGAGSGVVGALIPPASPLTDLMYALGTESGEALFGVGDASLEFGADLSILSGQMWHNWAEDTGEEVSNVQKAQDLQAMTLLMFVNGYSYDEVAEYRRQTMIEHDLHYEILPEMSTLITAAVAGAGAATGGATGAAGTQTTATAASLEVIGGLIDAAFIEDDEARAEAILALDATQIDPAIWENVELIAPAMTQGEEAMEAAANQLTAGELAAMERKKGQDARSLVVDLLAESASADDEWGMGPGLVLFDQSNPGGLIIGWDGDLGDGHGEIWGTLGYTYEDLVRMIDDGTVQIVQPGDRGDTWSYYDFAASSAQEINEPDVTPSISDSMQTSIDNPYNGVSWEVLTSGWDGHMSTPFRNNVAGDSIDFDTFSYVLESVDANGQPDVWYIVSNIDGSTVGMKRSDREENTGFAWEIVGDEPDSVLSSEDSGDEDV
jgi:hypothetical protein